LTWNSTASYLKAISDVSKIQNWFYTQSSPSCIVLFNAIDETPVSNRNINLFPNPTNDFLTLEFNATNAASRFRIYDARDMLIENVFVNASGRTIIQTEQYAAGVYFVEIVDDGKIYFGKFIRQ
jgi:Secretion system C-terminal sorting domain